MQSVCRIECALINEVIFIAFQQNSNGEFALNEFLHQMRALAVNFLGMMLKDREVEKCR